MHLFEEIEEKTEMEEGGTKEDATYKPDKYDLTQPDLQLQYLVAKANLMEMKQELTQEDEQDLFNVTHFDCDCKECTDWSETFSSRWQPTIMDLQATLLSGALAPLMKSI